MNHTISIVKGFAIILMVIAHAGCPELGVHFIYGFHMPLFFFVSGYLFKDVYLSEPKKFVVNKFKGLYVPFVQWMLIFLLLHNMMAYLGIYDSTYTIKEIAIRGAKTLLMYGGESMLGGYWFLRSLLVASLISYGSIWICKKLNISVIYPIILILYTTYVVSKLSFQIPYINTFSLIGTVMFLCGYIYKNSKLEVSLTHPIWIILGYTFSFATVMGLGCKNGMGSTGWQVFGYSFAAICGTLATYVLAQTISKHTKYISLALQKVGEQTLYILTFHILSFKLVSWLIITLYPTIGTIADFPVITIGGGWWVLYSIVGVCVPMLLWILKENTLKIFRRQTTKRCS